MDIGGRPPGLVSIGGAIFRNGVPLLCLFAWSHHVPNIRAYNPDRRETFCPFQQVELREGFKLSHLSYWNAGRTWYNTAAEDLGRMAAIVVEIRL